MVDWLLWWCQPFDLEMVVSYWSFSESTRLYSIRCVITFTRCCRLVVDAYFKICSTHVWHDVWRHDALSVSHWLDLAARKTCRGLCSCGHYHNLCSCDIRKFDGHSFGLAWSWPVTRPPDFLSCTPSAYAQNVGYDLILMWLAGLIFCGHVP